MKKYLPWAVVFLAGLLVGAAGLRAIEALTVDPTLDRQKAEAVRLAADLKEKEAALAADRVRVEAQAAQIHDEVTQTTGQLDLILAAQGSAVDRLKKVTAAVRRLAEDLKAAR